jgi:hypothetical protein
VLVEPFSHGAAVPSGARGGAGRVQGHRGAGRVGVSRQSVHNWIARYDKGGLASLADRSTARRAVPARPSSRPRPSSAGCAAIIPGGGPAPRAPAGQGRGEARPIPIVDLPVLIRSQERTR